MASDPFPFMASSKFQTRPGPGLWFAFRKRQLLIVDGWSVPRGPSLDVYGVAPLRVQYLGMLAGEPCYSAELSAESEAPDNGQFRDLRQLFGRLDDGVMAVAGRAVQIMEWDRTHQFCGACASPTVPHERTRSRVCSNPACAIEHYPKLAPAMIVAVERGPEILLARSHHFPPGIYSVLAGFVDPGESAEDAVRREVFEETALQVDNIRYFGSQAWPFPNSLMLGFQADYVSGDIVPEAEEIEDAKFFHIDDLPKRFPGRVSIAQWLLDDFCERHGKVMVR